MAAAFDDEIFRLRLERSRDDLFGMLGRLYGAHPDYPAFAEALGAALRAAWRKRPRDLKWLDLRRDLEPDWFQRPGMAGYVFYIDRFAGTLEGVREKLPYLKDLGITYVHFMPCLKPRPGDSDGGYSVMDYRKINPAFGTMAEFEALCRELREAGISVCVDMVLNHTAKEHDWAKKARARETRSTATTTCSSPTTGCPRPTRRRWSRSSPRTRRAASPITPTSANGSGPPSTNTSGT
jgi:amylosucrase